MSAGHRYLTVLLMVFKAAPAKIVKWWILLSQIGEFQSFSTEFSLYTKVGDLIHDNLQKVVSHLRKSKRLSTWINLFSVYVLFFNWQLLIHFIENQIPDAYRDQYKCEI
jgi:hypothetical protein